MEAKSSSARPVKSILKNRSSGGGSGLGLAASAEASAALQAQQAAGGPGQPSREGPPEERKKSQKWDEMNILATYHPAGKDYGLMKIDEPSTPYHGMVGDDEDAGSDTETHEAPAADVLAKKLAAAAEGKGPRALAEQEESSDEDDDEMELSAEELEKKRQFEMKRKMHYNEAQNIKLARQLIAKELRGDAAAEDDDDDDEEMRDTAGSRQMNPAPVPAPSDPLENIAHGLEEVCSGL